MGSWDGLWKNKRKGNKLISESHRHQIKKYGICFTKQFFEAKMLVWFMKNRVMTVSVAVVFIETGNKKYKPGSNTNLQSTRRICIQKHCINVFDQV
jgi:hypothetical protein